MSKDSSTFVEKLFEAGSHFGFKKSRRHPTVTPYLYGTRDGNDIFDLEKTTELLEAAKEVLKEAGSQGKTVLFVGTKDEASAIVKAAAEEVEAPYVTNRWIGGMLTNWSEIKKRINRLEALNHERESGEMERKYTKKERVVLGRETDKLNFNFFGISKMPKVPDMMLVIDPRHDEIAVTEALEKNIPVMAIMSSDCDASRIAYPVVANDSLQTSVKLLLGELTAAYAEGKSAFVPKPVEARPSRPVRRREG
jgi:small subunit ribosomal protein S2